MNRSKYVHYSVQCTYYLCTRENLCVLIMVYNDTCLTGLSGDETVIDVGSPSYLLPLVDRNKVYDIRDFKRLTGSDPLFVAGAGAGPWPHVGVNSEVSCVRTNDDDVEYIIYLSSQHRGSCHILR